MAARISEALERREQLLVEAGTGTGKTFAYLVPALLSGLRVLVSTGTRTLQDQLFHRDLPLLVQRWQRNRDPIERCRIHTLPARSGPRNLAFRHVHHLV